MEPFVQVKNAQTLLEILTSRLPRSANIFNMAKMHSRFLNDMKFYTIFGDLSENCWIITTYTREDTGQEIQISSKTEWTTELEDAFLRTKVIDWTKPYFFISIDRRISVKLIELNIRKGNNILVNPNWVHFMSLDEAKEIQLETNGIIVKPLEGDQGTKFLYDNWSYSIKGTEIYISKMVDRNETAAVYVNGVPVSGIILSCNGYMALLNTIKEERRKGYAVQCTKQLMKIISQNGFYPCTTVEHLNTQSLGLHKDKLNLQISHEVDYIRYQGSMFQK